MTYQSTAGITEDKSIKVWLYIPLVNRHRMRRDLSKLLSYGEKDHKYVVWKF